MELPLISGASAPALLASDLAIDGLSAATGRTAVGSRGPAVSLRWLQRPAAQHQGALGQVSDAELPALLRNARARLPGVEDFGITLLEVQATGCPVIAFAGGGGARRRCCGTTGLFFQQTIDSLETAVAEFDAFEAERLRRRPGDAFLTNGLPGRALPRS